jgi:hypothetical protein
VEIGTEAAQFPEKKYINGVFVAVFNSLSALKFRAFAGRGYSYERYLSRRYLPHQMNIKFSYFVPLPNFISESIK